MINIRKIITVIVSISCLSFVNVNASENDLSNFCYNDCSYEREQFRKYSKKGSSLAMLNYGLMLVTGKGGEQDIERGIKWIKKASSNGELSAQYQLGYFYTFGLHLEQDLEKGKKLLSRAFNKGLKPAKQYYEWVEKDAIKTTQEVYSQHKKRIDNIEKRSKSEGRVEQEGAKVEVISISPGFTYREVLKASIRQVCVAVHCGPEWKVTVMPVLKLAEKSERLFVNEDALLKI